MTDFLLFKQNNDFCNHITQHSKDSYQLIEDRVDGFHILDRDRQNNELELYHKVLKHARTCEDTNCTLQEGGELIQRLIIQDILPRLHVLSSYPLLICMVDIVKNDSLALDRDTLHRFLSSTCQLWQHEKIYMCRKSMELCKRIIPSLDSGKDVLVCIVNYIHACRKNLTLQDLERIQSLDYTEFFYILSTNMTFDRECIKLLVQIVLSVFLHHSMDQADCIHTFILELKELISGDSQETMTVLFDICCANDDDTVQLLDMTLVLYQQNTSTLFLNFLQEIDITPHTLFLFFLSRCGNNHNIIIDLLLEDDSNFLSYFCKYLVYANENIASLMSALKDDTFSTIIANTILILEGDGFPYNTKPLIRRLIQLDDNLNNKLPT